MDSYILERNLDKRMAVLDIKKWIDRDEDNRQKILYTFYKKEVSSPYTILKRSALSYKIKRSTLFQEALRRIYNISESLPWSEKATHLTAYSNMLRISGYTQKERYHFVKGAISRYS